MAFAATCLFKTPSSNLDQNSLETHALNAWEYQHPEGRIEQNHFETSIYRLHQFRLMIERHTDASYFSVVQEIKLLNACRFHSNDNQVEPDLYLVNRRLLI